MQNFNSEDKRNREMIKMDDFSIPCSNFFPVNYLRDQAHGDLSIPCEVGDLTLRILQDCSALF